MKSPTSKHKSHSGNTGEVSKHTSNNSKAKSKETRKRSRRYGQKERSTAIAYAFDGNPDTLWSSACSPCPYQVDTWLGEEGQGGTRDEGWVGMHGQTHKGHISTVSKAIEARHSFFSAHFFRDQHDLNKISNRFQPDLKISIRSRQQDHWAQYESVISCFYIGPVLGCIDADLCN